MYRQAVPTEKYFLSKKQKHICSQQTTILVKKKLWSGWDSAVKQGATTIHKDSAAYSQLLSPVTEAAVTVTKLRCAQISS